jgi:tricorn protease-like protein
LTNPNYLIKAVYRLNVYYKILAFNIYLKPRNLQGSYLKLLALFLLGMVTHFVLSKPLILQPQISPNGKHIAFTYQGDIWTVNSNGGRADRLTIHEGYECRRTWDKNSERIAFSSDRFGNNDIFIMPSNGFYLNALLIILLVIVLLSLAQITTYYLIADVYTLK